MKKIGCVVVSFCVFAACGGSNSDPILNTQMPEPLPSAPPVPSPAPSFAPPPVDSGITSSPDASVSDGGTPDSGVTAPQCTTFVYTAYGPCQPNNTQQRTVTGSLPQGCVGGNPVTTQACVYVPPPQCSYLRYTSTSARASGPQTADWGLGTADWTVEAWLRVMPGTSEGGIWTTNENYTAHQIGFGYSQGTIRFGTYRDSCPCGPGTGNLSLPSSRIDDSMWHHVSVVRSGGTARVFVDGVPGMTDVISTSLVAASPISFGKLAGYPGSYAALGIHVGPVRFSRGRRYSQGFVPSTSWPIDQQTIGQWNSLSVPVGNVITDEAGGNNNVTIVSDIVVEKDAALCH